MFLIPLRPFNEFSSDVTFVALDRDAYDTVLLRFLHGFPTSLDFPTLAAFAGIDVVSPSVRGDTFASGHGSNVEC